MTKDKVRGLIADKIEHDSPHLAFTLAVDEFGKTTFPSGKKGHYAKGVAFCINRHTGNSEKATFTFTSVGTNWQANFRLMKE